MVLLVLALSVVVGVTLGLLGGGGSILSVPILTYAAGMTTKAAITSSLFLVAVTSLAALVPHARAGRVRWRIGISFGVAGMLGAFLGGQLASLLPGPVLMTAFAAMMLITGIAMLRPRRASEPKERRELPLARITALGFGVGVITGCVGAGGGFVVVPALILLGGLATEAAVGTSLLAIAMSSASGFASHLTTASIDWRLTLAATGAAIVGAMLGGALVGRVPPAALRRYFGGFVLLMAGFVLFKALA